MKITQSQFDEVSRDIARDGFLKTFFRAIMTTIRGEVVRWKFKRLLRTASEDQIIEVQRKAGWTISESQDRTQVAMTPPAGGGRITITRLHAP
jgi:hypothetical protein